MRRNVIILLVGVALVAATAGVLGATWLASDGLPRGTLEAPCSETEVCGVAVQVAGGAIRGVDGGRLSIRAVSVRLRITIESRADREVALRLNVANTWRPGGQAHVTIARGAATHSQELGGGLDLTVEPGERVTLDFGGPPEKAQEYEFVVVEGGGEPLADRRALLRSLATNPPAFLVYRDRERRNLSARAAYLLSESLEEAFFPVFLTSPPESRAEGQPLRRLLPPRAGYGEGCLDAEFLHAGGLVLVSDGKAHRAVRRAGTVAGRVIRSDPETDAKAHPVDRYPIVWVGGMARRGPDALADQDLETWMAQLRMVVCFSDEAGLYGFGQDGKPAKLVDAGRLPKEGRMRAWRVRVHRDGEFELVEAWTPKRTWQGKCTVARTVAVWSYAARRQPWLLYAGVGVAAGWFGLLAWLGARGVRRVWTALGCHARWRGEACLAPTWACEPEARSSQSSSVAPSRPPEGSNTFGRVDGPSSPLTLPKVLKPSGGKLLWACGAVLIALAAAWLYLDGLGARHISVSNESNRVEATREMVLSHDFMLPHINGRIYLTKPPLYYWLSAALWPGSGFHEFRWRLSAVLPALACLVVVYAFARRWFGGRVGLVSLVVLGTAPMFFVQAWEAELDSLLCLLTTLSLCLFYTAFEAERRRLALFLAAFVVLAGATMTKGPVPLVIVVLTLATYLVATRGRRAPCWPHLLIGTALLAVLVVPWCIAVVHRLGLKPAWTIFMDESVRRVGSASRINYKPFYYYLGNIPACLMPWSVWIPAAVMVAWRQGRRWREDRTGRAVLFLGAWFVPNLVFFSISAGKQAQYVLPLYPALAMACALAAVRWKDSGCHAQVPTWACMQETRSSKSLSVAPPQPERESALTPRERLAFGAGTCLAAVSLIVGGLIGPGVLAHELPGAETAAAAVGAVVAVAGAAALACWRRGALGGLLVALVAVFAACKQLYVGEVIPRENAADSARAFCRRVGEIVPPDVPIVMYGRERSAYSLYTGRVVREMAREAKEGEAPPEGKPVYFLTTGREYERLAKERSDLARCELASHTGHPSVLIANRAAVARARAASERRLSSPSAESP